MPIRVLSPEVAGKIAAGEVVERPASAVKELVENSIDAGARAIRVEVLEGGRRLIRVSDDGCGIPADEVPIAFARHTTSKLATVDDLDCIATLGFRGEALASIAAVSQVSVLTRPAGQPVGRFVRVEGGYVTRQEGRGCPTGTTVTVEHLFREVPARLKFLRLPQTEAGHIYTVVSQYALAYPQLRFSLTADGRETFQASGSGRLLDVVIAVYGLEVAEQLIPLEQSSDVSDEAVITGNVGVPSLHRADRTHITLFVNRRWIQDRALAHSVIQAYHTLLPVGRFPLAILCLQVPPQDLDVNVHPTKREVKFRDARGVFGAVQRAVRQALVEHSPVPYLGTRVWPAPEWERRQNLASLQVETDSRQLDLGSGLRPDAAPTPVGPIRLPLLRVVGQVGQTYVVAEGPQGLYLIDQHAAHERVLYEQMQRSLRDHTSLSQALLEPALLELDPLLAGILEEYQDPLRELGVALEPFGGTGFLVRAVPPILNTADVRTTLVEILQLLREGEDTLALQADERLIAAVCKRAAIKSGQTLAYEEMQQLVRALEQCESPRTCPHGRPTVLHFAVEQLEKEFGRR